MKQLRFFLTGILILLFPLMGFAQVHPPRPVAVMPFTGGETDAVNRQFRTSAGNEILRLPRNFRPTLGSLPPGVSAEDFPPDEPPPSYLVEGWQYVVTGASFLEYDGIHLQIWLWDVLEPTLIYTDELVCEVIEDAREFMPLLIEWIFSHVPDLEREEEKPIIQITVAPPEIEIFIREEEPAPIPEDEAWWFYVGGQLGGSVRQYVAPGNADDTHPFINKQSQLSPSFEVAIHGTFQILPLLALQGGVMFTMDFVSFPVYYYSENAQDGSMIVESTVDLRYMSLMFPLLLKLTFEPGPFLIAPYLGASYILPLGAMDINSPWEDQYPSESLSYQRDLSLAGIAGLTLGMKMDRFKKGLLGRAFVDIRFSADIGLVSVQQTPNHISAAIKPFRQGMFSVNVGWEIPLVRRGVRSR